MDGRGIVAADLEAVMSYHDDPDWAEDHGYYHWKCRKCGMSGWTDTTPDCACREIPPEMETTDETDTDT